MTAVRLTLPRGAAADHLAAALAGLAARQLPSATHHDLIVELPDGLVELPVRGVALALGMDDGRPSIALPRAYGAIARLIARPAAYRELADGRAVLGFELHPSRPVSLAIPGVGSISIAAPPPPDDVIDGEIV